MEFEELPNPDGSNTLPIPDGPWFANKTITRETSRWEVTERTHGSECTYCDAAEESAITHAFVRGAIAGGYSTEYRQNVHRAYVERKN